MAYFADHFLQNCFGVWTFKLVYKLTFQMLL